MTILRTLALTTALTAVTTTAALAADPVKVGMITTLSGPAGYIGEQMRDGFMLAIEDGMLGGVEVEILVEDDQLNPGHGRQIADAMVYDEEVKIMTGIIFSNVAGAVVPDVVSNDVIYISPNAGPSTLAGKACDPNYFVVSWQNDTLHEVPGMLATKKGYEKAFLMAPNYQAGKDALVGFMRGFEGEAVGELYTQLDQVDFAPEIAQIRAAQPDVLYQFLPGALGINFLKQYDQAGLEGIDMVLPEPVDAVMIGAIGEAVIGLTEATHWAPNFDNPASTAFVAAWVDAYGDRPLTAYAEQGYTAALAIASGLLATGGDVSDVVALRDAIAQADFESPRGDFAFGVNQHPIMDWYEAKIVAGDTGPQIIAGDLIAEDVGDVYAAECSM
ncbi:ABC transporter substrate-binding protein [Antarcticimicrobium sediminis]|uniref:ABC transporter substrate-binding protein n=1 Tax=Antarcticimicrobium sediminis TaxID=2546227 RepID=A0A4R5ESM2_9RHOB|nr:ABC transporter substrate-binding protein [Antarcticimicrobium sediminis]TDE37849.1 ABC transporter substrate-binding protein [Antarcticimicrobium sediminis]